MAEPHVRNVVRERPLELTRQEILARARPLQHWEDLVIEDLTEEEERVFMDAIFNA